MMKGFPAIVFVLVFNLLSFSIHAQNKKAKGNLFIIGGGNRSEALINKMVATAGLKDNDYVIVLPMASAEPDTGYAYISRQLAPHTRAVVRNFDFSKHDVNDKKWLDSLAGARLIYILGGDQNRFMKVVLNTPVYRAIHAAHQNGSTIAGTSAGAAVMSRYMITGSQLKDPVYKETFDKIWDANIEFSEGMGLLNNTIIDQHFVRRSRYNRLISALAAKPGFVCIGIDEGTAIIVHGNKATVAGDSQVLRFTSRNKAGVTATGLLRFKHIRLGVYTEGEVMKLKR